MQYTISYVENPQHKDVKILEDGITEYAKQKKGHKPIEFFAFFIRDADNKVKGGCKSTVFYGCIYVDLLWIDESLRGQGYGTRLMRATEELGKEKKCTFAAVSTMDWEALDFYKKLGYYVESERHGFFKDSVFYFLRKDFAK